MPQNWWELFPEVHPSPAARPRALPGPGGAMSGPAMGPRQASPHDALAPDQAPLSAFDPSYFSGADLRVDEIPSLHLGQALPSSYGQPPFAGDEAQPAVDRSAAISHASAAIQRGADPNLVRARLRQMGHADLNPSTPFSDLVPDEPQDPLDGYAPGRPGTPQGELHPTLSHQAGWSPSARASAFSEQMPTMDAISKRTRDVKSAVTAAAFQPDDPPEDPFTHMIAADERGVVEPGQARAAENLPNVTSNAKERNSSTRVVQQRRRRENEAALNDPRVLAFLDTIAFAEDSDYNTMFGHGTFSDMSRHPGNVGARFGHIPQSAAGRYQIQLDNYNTRVARMGPLDMSPRLQDLMAADILRAYGGLGALQANDFESAVSNLSGQWASFPHRVNGAWRGSRYPRQTARPIEALHAFYDRALQYYSSPNALIPPRKRPPLQVRRH